jgi:hypothetical protein
VLIVLLKISRTEGTWSVIICSNYSLFREINAVGCNCDFEVKLNRPPSVFEGSPVETNEIFQTTNKSPRLWQLSERYTSFSQLITYDLLPDSFPGGSQSCPTIKLTLSILCSWFSTFYPVFCLVNPHHNTNAWLCHLRKQIFPGILVSHDNSWENMFLNFVLWWLCTWKVDISNKNS